MLHRSAPAQLMLDFAERTGLSSNQPQRRYLWTDAFAVRNFLALHESTGEVGYRELALRLIDNVHRVLGRHRADDPRTGWLSGPDQLAESHPTRGGLRIGKPQPERAPHEVPDERLEWDRDGQYFHYLTRWMTALNHAATSSAEARFNLWARELAEAAHRAFVYRVAGAHAPRMFWKMSIDLTRPLVRSMGQHDPLDGYVTFRELQAVASRLGDVAEPRLTTAMSDFASMLENADFVSTDPLGLGGLLTDAHRLQRLDSDGPSVEPGLVDRIVSAALLGLQYYARQGELRLPAHRRLAFRELGLAIGLSDLERLVTEASRAQHGPLASRQTRAQLTALSAYLSLGAAIKDCWLAPEHRATPTWLEHRDINEVMLATSLLA